MSRKLISWVRDGCKANYVKKDHCEKCKTTEGQLEVHHLHTVSLIVSNFLKGREELSVDEFRAAIYEAHWPELVEETVTLCVPCHERLHKIYGVAPALLTAEKQRRWVFSTKKRKSLLSPR